MADRSEVRSRLSSLRDEIRALVEGANPDAWSTPAYEDGWTAKDVLAHIASTCGPASFLLMMSQVSGSSDGGGSFDGEAFNKQQIEIRASHSPKQILDEVRDTLQRDIQSVESATDEALQKHYQAPWGLAGAVSDLIIMSIDGHLGGHVADLRNSLTA